MHQPKDYAPATDTDYDYRRTHPVCAGLQAAFWAVFVMLAVYGAYALVCL